MALREENPFTDDEVAKEWINSVENERGRTRDREVYPYLKNWASGLTSTEVIVEVGSGQGICSEKLESPAQYIGVEPSDTLTARAKEKYASPNRSFIKGDAYQIPVDDSFADAVLSVNVLFHIEDVSSAVHEMSRILKPQGKFLIVSANPDSYDFWESLYVDPEKNGKRLVGKICIPVNPLSRNTLYKHSLEEMLSALQAASLSVSKVSSMGAQSEEGRIPIFIVLEGHKIG